MNIVFVGDTSRCMPMAKQLWSKHKDYSLLGVDDLLDKTYQQYIKTHKYIAVTDTKQFMDRDVIAVVKEFVKENALPIFIAENGKSFERIMHSNIEEMIVEAMLVLGDVDEKDKKELLDIVTDYIREDKIIKTRFD